jgi:hypothetical protein
MPGSVVAVGQRAHIRAPRPGGAVRKLVDTRGAIASVAPLS